MGLTKEENRIEKIIKNEDFIENKIARIIRKVDQLTSLFHDAYINIYYSGNIRQFAVILRNKTNHQQIIRYELFLDFSNVTQKLEEIEKNIDKKINELIKDTRNSND